VFHRGQAVRIASNKDDPVNRLRHCVVGYVKTNAHIDALLLEVRFEVSVGQCLIGDWHLLRFETAKFQDAPTHRKQILGR
jgi:hypothetical protein